MSDSQELDEMVQSACQVMHDLFPTAEEAANGLVEFFRGYSDFFFRCFCWHEPIYKDESQEGESNGMGNG